MTATLNMVGYCCCNTAGDCIFRSFHNGFRRNFLLFSILVCGIRGPICSFTHKILSGNLKACCADECTLMHRPSDCCCTQTLSDLLAVYFMLISCSATHRCIRWRQYVPPKRELTFTGLHGVISQKIVTAVRTSNPTLCEAIYPKARLS
jgi:hypothetical protein